MQYEASFDFLGSRNYVHSTSLSHTLLKIMYENDFIGRFDFIDRFDGVFRHRIAGNGHYVFNEKPGEEAKAVFNIVLKDKTLKAYFYETGVAISSKAPYDEDGLAASCHIDSAGKKASVRIGGETGALLNVIVALNKKMLLDILPKDGYSSWSAGKFDLEWTAAHKDSKNGSLELVLVNNLDDLYTKSDIFLKGKKYGSICFARSRIVI